MVITDNGVWGSIFGLDGTNIQYMYYPKVNCNHYGMKLADQTLFTMKCHSIISV